MDEDKALESPKSFVYRPLDPSKREIRLFYIDSISTSSDIVTGTIFHVSLDKPLECDANECYDTVSYVWGNLELCKTVLVEGCTLPVTKNADSALRSMRFSRETRRIWIDSICIDQTNLEERAQQVMLMGSIYAESCLNLIHLIDDNGPLFDRAIANINAIYEEILVDISESTDEDNSASSINSNKLPKFQSYIIKDEDFGKHWTRSQTPLKTELDVEALLKFFSNPWFCRMWVVQEAVVAPYNECFCGEHEINLRIIMRVAVWLSHKYAFIPEDLQASQGIINLTNLWYLEEVHNPIQYTTRLDTLLEYTFRRQATDLRDKVYGLLGVTRYSGKEKTIPDLIRPDYTKTVDQVAQDATRFMIRESKDLQIFRYIDHGKDPGPPPDICSWRIPLAAKQKGHVDYLVPFYRGVIPSLKVLSEEAALACTKDPDRLQLTGFRIELVADVSNFIPRPPVVSRPFLHFVLAELEAFLSTSSDQVRSSQFRRSLAKTLVAGVFMSQAIATEQEIDVFEEALGRTLDEYGRPSPPTTTSSPSAEELPVTDYELAVWTWAVNRKLFFTASGKLGLGPGALQPGDAVFAVHGSIWPVVLRRNREIDAWQLLGVAYIDGVMNGEAAEEYKKAAESPATLIVR